MTKYTEVYKLEGFSISAQYDGDIVTQAKVEREGGFFRVLEPQTSKVLAVLVKKASQAGSTEERFVSSEEIKRLVWGKKALNNLDNNINVHNTKVNNWFKNISLSEKYKLTGSEGNYYFEGSIKEVVTDKIIIPDTKLEMPTLFQTRSESSVPVMEELAIIDQTRMLSSDPAVNPEELISTPVQFQSPENRGNEFGDNYLKEEISTEQFGVEEDGGVEYQNKFGKTIAWLNQHGNAYGIALGVILSVACTLTVFTHYYSSPSVPNKEVVTFDDVGIQTDKDEPKNLKPVVFAQSAKKRYVEFNKHRPNAEQEKSQVVADRIDVGVNTADYQIEEKNIGLVIIDPVGGRWGWGNFVSNNGKFSKLFSVQIGEKQDEDQYFTLLLVTSLSKIPKTGPLTDEQLEKIEVLDSIRVKKAKSTWN